MSSQGLKWEAQDLQSSATVPLSYIIVSSLGLENEQF